MALTWQQTEVTVMEGETATVTFEANSFDAIFMAGGGAQLVTGDSNIATAVFGDSANNGIGYAIITGVSAGTTTVTGIDSTFNFEQTNTLTITVVSAEDESYLNKRGLTHFWENIDTLKQDKLTAGAGIAISNNVISATGGGTADAVDWGHITGSMSNQTDLTTALAAKANSADLATVAATGDYDDLTDKPTIGNATLTIQKNGTSAGTFTANAASNKTINITVPTTAADVSALPASTKYGASIEVTIDPSDYKVTTTLKDQDGNRLGAAQTIDLPLESVVVNGSYDSTNKKIVLTLQSGSTIDIPVGDLVAGLQSEITSTNKLSSDLVDDTNHTHKFVTAAQITKLNGIAAGAEVNVQSDWDQTTTTADDYIKNKPTIPTVSNGKLTIQKNGTNVATFTANASSNATANITVPTAVTDLSDASNYVTQTDIADVIRTTDVGVIKGQNIADSEITSSKIDWTTQTYTVTLGQHIESYSEVTVKSFGGIAAIKGFLVTNAMVAQGEALFTINNCPDALKNQRIPTTGAAGIPYYYIDYDGKAFYDIGTVPVGNILFGVTFI